MRNLVFFFLKYNHFFVFLFLEIISFYLIVNSNEKQKVIFASSANQFTGYLFERYDKATQYWNLGAVNKELANDNKRLMERLEQSYFNNIVDTLQIQDSTYSLQYEYIPAEVVNNSVFRYNNYLTLNRGSKHGIKANTGVVSSSGIVGVIRKTSAHYTSVMSILHHNTRISAAIRRNNYFGSLIWTDGDPLYMNLDAIPKHADVVKGDTVITSGFSDMFPKGIMVGTVESATLKDGSNFYDIKVRLSCDMSKIKHVFVINNLMATEKQQLEASVENE